MSFLIHPKDLTEQDKIKLREKAIQNTIEYRGRKTPAPINLILTVQPVAKGRAKAAVINGHVREYTPAKTRNAEAEVRISIRENIKHALQWDMSDTYFPREMPLRLEAMFVIPRPASAPKKRHLPIARPDADNYVKLLTDSLNHFLYVDDSQLTTVIIKKRYGMMPAIHLKVCEDDDKIMPDGEVG